MSLQYANLDDETRKFMVEEIEFDLAAGRLYLGTRLSPSGRAEYQHLLLEAAKSGTDDSLAEALRQNNRLLERELINGRDKKVPVNAAETLAEGEFNRFYIRAVCRRALTESPNLVEVYRAKAALNPRLESQSLIGSKKSAETLLEDLRNNIGGDTERGIPGGPNSGLSVRL